MASLLALVDPNVDRRARFVERARAQLAPVAGLRLGGLECGDFVALWAAGERAPLEHANEGGNAALVVGDAVAGPPYARVGAKLLLAGWPLTEGSTPAAFDGYHAALRYDPHGGLSAGSDLLGLFPIYYASRGEVLLLGTSPELFSLHPLFPFKTDPEGLVGLLLAHALVEGRSLFREVRRLQAGHVLRWKKGAPREELAYRITTRPEPGRFSFPEQMQALHEAHAIALERLAPPQHDVGILLSGGLDTRVLAGYLAASRKLGNEIGHSSVLQALTFGSESDYEVRSARAVAAALGMRHRVVGLEVDDLSQQAALQLRWHDLSAGFSNLHNWDSLGPLREMPPRFVAGWLASAIGPASQRAPDFDSSIASTDHRGFRPQQLHRLLHPRLRSLVDERLQTLRHAYLSASELPHERTWRFDLSYRYRAHPGQVPWRLSLASWPVVPILDRALLDLCASLPLSTLRDRVAQIALVRARFPALARLPLDRNSHDTMPLAPTTVRSALNPLIVAGRRLRQRALAAAGAGVDRERRYYHRLYDMRGTGWQRLRQAAEPFRDRLSGVFDMDELARWLPPPSVPLTIAHPVREGFRPKLLLGLMLWTADHPM